jgi:hypothetical protein
VCTEADAVSGVARQSTVDLYGPTIPGTSLGVLDGVYMSDCSGATDNAGNVAGATAQVKWTMTYLLGGITSPKAGTVLSHTATKIIVRTSFASMSTYEEAARAAAHEIRATLSGPNLTKPAAALCTWNATLLNLQCSIGVPHGVTTGRKYAVTVYENFGSGWLKVLPAATRENPEPLYFK